MRRALIGAAALYALFPASALAAEAGPTRAGYTEMNDRQVDEAALSSHRAAMARLAQLAKTKRGSPQEPVFLLRLSEITHQVASIEFRIAHGKARLKPGSAVNLDAYNKLLKQSIEPLSDIITRYPKDNGISRAYFLRAKAYAETKQRDLAVQDFKVLIEKYGASRDLISASFYLYDILIDAKEYPTAIMYMKRLRLAPDDPNFTLAMDHLAWAHFYINDLDQALKYIEYQVAYYHRRKTASRGLAAEWEKAMMNAALFYSTGVTTNRPGYDVKTGLGLFLKLRPTRGILSKALVHFAYLLRARGMDQQLEDLKTAAFDSPIKDAEAIDLALVVYENELNRLDLNRIRETSAQLSQWMEANRKVAHQKQRWDSAQKAIMDTAANLQGLFVNKKGTEESGPYSSVLISLYGHLLKASEGTPDRVRLIKIHFNLAEILFESKDFEGATTHYRWIVDNGVAVKNATVDKKKVVNDRAEGSLVEEARVKAVASRYESLMLKGLFPKDLAARNMDGVKPIALTPDAEAWISWVQDLVKWTKDPKTAEVFFFESNRMLYSQGHIEAALKGMASFFRTNPSSKFAIPSAALILDTYVASEKWEWAYGLCEELLKIEQWKKTEFHEKVLTTAGDTSVKIVELHYKRGLYKDALVRAQAFLLRFPKSRHRDDALLLAANSALALKDKRQALTFFEPLLKSGNAKPDTLALAYLTSTSVSEETYDFKAAAAEMRKYMGVAGPPNNLIAPDELRKARVKTLMLSVLSGDPKDLSVTLNSKVVCSSPKDIECERYQGVSVLLDQRKRVSRTATEEALSRINKVDPSNRVYFATVALEDRRGLSLEDNFKMFQYVQVDFAKLDWILRYNILTPLSTSVPDAVRQSRKQIKSMSKLKIAKAAIDKRVKLMTQLENSANKLLVLPSILIRVNVLNELANMYDDFLVELTQNAVPAGSGKVEREAILASINPITQPFELKRNELRKKAFDLASENAVGDETFESVSTAYFNENPEIAKTLRPGWLPPRRRPIDVTILDRVDPDGGWNKPGSYKALVYAAIRDRDWPRAAFFMQEIENKSELSEPLYFVVKAAALAGVGAQAEALVKLLEAAEKMSSSSSAQAALMLECIPRLYRSYSKLKVKGLIEKLAELRKPNDLGQDAITIAHAARWAEADLSGSYRSALFAFIPVDRVPTSEPKVEAKAPQQPQEDKQ